MESLIATARLLVVSRDAEVLRSVSTAAESNLWQLDIAASAWDAMEKLQANIAVDVLLIDLPQEETDGLRSLRWLRRLRPELPIVLIDRVDGGNGKRQPLQMSNRDFLVAPLVWPKLEAAIQCSLSAPRQVFGMDITSDDVEPLGNGKFFIGLTPGMRSLRGQVALLAEADLPVFIWGERGSGKETIARLLHRLSVRCGFAFAKVDCAALPEDLLEKEIFGYEVLDGATTPRTQCGKLEQCARGTIFLDEIAEMPLRLQSKLVKVLQSGRFVRPGTSEIIEVDVRITAASTVSFEQVIAERRVSVELSSRLGACVIHVPPLRERKDELPSLSSHFMHQLSRHYGLAPRNISGTTETAWQAHEWPGNLDELEQAVKRYLIAGETDPGMAGTPQDSKSEGVQSVLSEQLKLSQIRSLPPPPTTSITTGKSLRSILRSVREETERSAIAQALERTGWNRKAAARLLKVSYRWILYKIDQYQMTTADRSAFLAVGRFGPGEADVRGSDHQGAVNLTLPRAPSGKI